MSRCPFCGALIIDEDFRQINNIKISEPKSVPGSIGNLKPTKKNTYKPIPGSISAIAPRIVIKHEE